MRGSGGAGLGRGCRLHAFFLAEDFEAFALEFQPRLLQLAPAHIHYGRSELSDGIEPRFEFVFRHDLQIPQKAGVMGEKHDVQVIGGDAGGSDLAGVLGEDAGFVEEGIEGEPFFVAAGAPFREVALGNRAAFELFRHDFHDIRVRVQPFDKAISRFAIGEAGVELLPDFKGDSRNLSVTRFHSGFSV